jgi:hypothetical protein
LRKQEIISFSLEIDLELSDSTIQKVTHLLHETRKSAASPSAESTASTSTSSTEKTYIKEQWLRYRVTIEMLPQSAILRVADEYLAALKTDGTLNDKRKPFLEKSQNKLVLRMEG